MDRIYEKYLELETDSKKEFESHAKRLKEQNPTQADKFFEELVPFRDPETGRYYTAEKSFDITKLGFRYDKLPEARPQQLRTLTSFAVFKNIRVGVC